MGIDDADHQIVLLAIRRMRKKLVKEIDELTGEGTSDLAIASAVLSAVVNVETIAAIEAHSRSLVRLTRALVGLTIALAVLTTVLVVVTFG